MEQKYRELAERAVSGSETAFCELYGEYKDKLYRYALYRLGDPSEAEDAVSECVLAAWKGITRLRSGDAFNAWIFRILHNICAGRIRGMIAERETLSEAAGSTDSFIVSQPTAGIELAEALGRLNEDEREIVLLSAVSGLSSREIADITGMTPGSVRSKLARSLSKMREFLN